MSDPITVISFYPKHLEYTDVEHEAKIIEYREWLDQHGRYGKLYMMDIGKMTPRDLNSKIIGLRIFDYGIAVLFKLMFEV